jgi:hypothetical protein
MYMSVGVAGDVETEVVSGDEYSMCTKVFYGKQEYIVLQVLFIPFSSKLPITQ